MVDASFLFDIGWSRHIKRLPLIFKWNSSVTGSKNFTAVKGHMMMCHHVVSFGGFKVITSGNSEFHLKIKEGLLISCDHPFWIKVEHVYSYICLIIYSLTWLFSYNQRTLIHCNLLLIVFSNKIYAPVSIKIVLKTCL